MSYKTRIIKAAIRWTPTALILWAGNIALKGIARLGDFNLDLDARKIYVKTTLYGEAEAIEVWLEDFAVLGDPGGAYHFILQQARANKPWLANLLTRIVKKPWKIPDLPPLRPHMALLAELLKPEHAGSAGA